MTREERELIEAELRCLKSDMFYASDIGDWKMARALEDLFDKVASAKTVIGIVSAFAEVSNDLKQTIQKRIETRKRINELEKELEKDNETEIIDL